MNKYKSYLPEFLGVLLALLALNLWYLSSLAIHNEVIPTSYDYIAKGLTVLVGAFIGAFSAFKLNEKKEAYKLISNEKLALNKTLFTLIMQINAVKATLNSFAPYTTRMDRALQLPALKPPKYDDLKFDFESLVFLLHDRPQLLMDLAIEQERFTQAYETVEIRNNFYVNEVQPALSRHELNGKVLPVKVFEEKLGERLFQGSINGAEEMYAHFEASDKSLAEMYEKLSKVSRDIFPGEKFVKWEGNV